MFNIYKIVVGICSQGLNYSLILVFILLDFELPICKFLKFKLSEERK